MYVPLANRSLDGSHECTFVDIWWEVYHLNDENTVLQHMDHSELLSFLSSWRIIVHLEELDKIKNLNWSACKSYYQRVEMQKQMQGWSLTLRYTWIKLV